MPQLTLRIGSTAKVLAECNLKYCRISECRCQHPICSKGLRQETPSTPRRLHMTFGMGNISSLWAGSSGTHNMRLKLYAAPGRLTTL